MKNIIIRSAIKNDLEMLLQFEQGVIQAERPFDTTLKQDPISYYALAEMIATSDAEIAVAELDNQLIGSGFARIENAKPYSQHKQHSYLGFMYVVPEHRGKGINKLIIDYLEAWTRSKQVYEMRLDVYADNLSAVKAYEKNGYSNHMIEMRKCIKTL